MEFKVNSGMWGMMFGVPCIVADNFLKLASEAQIKTLIYILRNNNRICTSEEISRAVGITSEQADEAILFWEQANLLSSDCFREKNSPVINSFMSAPAETETNTSVQPAENVKSSEISAEYQNNSSSGLKMNPSEIAEVVNNSADTRSLFQLAELQLGTLNYTMQKSLIWMHNYMGIPVDVIITLIVYCKSIDRTNIGYIEKIAYSWNENGITTLSLAEAEINRMSEMRTFVYAIMREFDMKRRPTQSQMEYITQWQKASYPIAMIKYAYEKTIEQLDKLKFSYINAILVKWSESGFRTVEDVKNSEEEYKKTNKPAVVSEEKSVADKYKSLINNI